jgi:hypothetical protein
MHATIRGYQGLDTARTDELGRKAGVTPVPQLRQLGGFKTPQLGPGFPNPPKITTGQVVAASSLPVPTSTQIRVGAASRLSPGASDARTRPHSTRSGPLSRPGRSDPLATSGDPRKTAEQANTSAVRRQKDALQDWESEGGATAEQPRANPTAQAA